VLIAPATQREQHRAQARKLKQIEKENRQQEEREQGKAMFENSSSTKGRKLGGAVPAFPSECCLTLRCGCSQEETKVPSDGPTCVCCLLTTVLGRIVKLQTERHPKAWRRMRLRIGHLTQKDARQADCSLELLDDAL